MSTTDVAPVAPRHPMAVPQTLAERIEYAKTLAAAGLLPAQFKNNPANVLWAMEYGDMLGIPPMAVMAGGVHVIEGKPTASAGLISGLVRRAGHRLRTTGDDRHAVAQIVRSDDPDFTFEAEWTLDRARNAALLGKDVWKKYGPNMLKHRAVSECANAACQEVIFGLITPEEMGAEVNKDGEFVTHPIRVPSARVDEPPPETTPKPDFPTMIRDAEIADDAATLKQVWDMAKGMFPHDKDLLDTIAAADEKVRARTHSAQQARAKAAEEPAAGTTKNRRGQLYALLRDGGVAGTDRVGRLRIVNRILNRPPTQLVESFDDLSADDMDVINARLQRHKDRGDLTHTLADLATETPPGEPGAAGHQGELWEGETQP